MNLHARTLGSDPVSRIVEELRRTGFEPRPRGDGWESRCPGHCGESWNLSITRGSDGRALLYCHAHKCTNDQILRPLGMKPADLFVDSKTDRPLKPSRPASKSKPKQDVEPKKIEPWRPKSKGFKSVEQLIDFLTGLFGSHIKTWWYRYPNETIHFGIARFDCEKKPGKKTYRPIFPFEGKYFVCDPPDRLSIYHLDEIVAQKDKRVWIVEGEKCADLLRSWGYLATTSAHGSQSAAKSDWSPLAGREVVVIPDWDEPGNEYAADVLTTLSELTPRPTIRKILLDELWVEDHVQIEEGEDIVDWSDHGVPESWSGHDCISRIDHVLSETDPLDWDDFDREVAAREATEESEESKGVPENGTALLLKILNGSKLWKTDDDRTIATVEQNGHKEPIAIDSPHFARWLVYRYMNESGRPPSADALAQTLQAISAKAYYEGETLAHPMRSAWDGSKLIVDLCDPSWRVVEVGCDGWRIAGSTSIHFRRSKGCLALPTPVEGGSLDELREILPLAEERDWIVLIAWLTFSLVPKGPYPLLILEGEQGSAKSTTSKMLKRLIDPHVTPTRSTPKSARDLAISAMNSHILTYDNLSRIEPWLSDAFCSLATGAGFATRQLHSDYEEAYFNSTNPLILNGIVDIATSPDLLDRSVILQLPPIDRSKRRIDAAIWRDFDRRHPRILGAILDTTARAIAVRDSITLDRLPRMADFAIWGEAVWVGLGRERGFFSDTYQTFLDRAIVTAVEHSPVAEAIREFASLRGDWSGTVSDLLTELGRIVSETKRSGRSWPKSPIGLAKAIERVSPVLRTLGVDVIRERSNSSRSVMIRSKVASSF